MLIVRSIGAGVAGYYLAQNRPGRWSPAAAGALHLQGPVLAADLTRVLQGRDPASGRYLPKVRPARRRAGYDLIFAAPKSVSLMGGDAVEGAHQAAVAAVLGHIEAEMGLSGQDLVWAAFDHRASAAGQPHLHTHVLVANLVRHEGRWSALPRNRIWEVDRLGLTALYQLDLRHQLEQVGLGLDWRVAEHGLADVVGVDRSAVRAASAQSILARRVGRIDARQQAVPTPWPAIEVPSRPPPTPASSPAAAPAGAAVAEEEDHLERRVAIRLGAQRSDFRRADVYGALAACHPKGLAVAAASDWAERFCAAQVEVPSPTSRPRWATPQSVRLDRELRDLLVERGHVVVLSAPVGQSALVAHAEAVSQQAERWRQEGATVVVDARDEVAAERWRALTGLQPRIRGAPADVVVVDGADRRTTAYLIGLARSKSSHLCLVEGGTLPRLTNPASHGARDAADILGRLIPAAPEPWRIGPPDLSRSGPGRQAAERVLADWHAAGRTGLLVGLGLDETAALNEAVRKDRGALDADHGRAQTYLVGDPVMALRRGPHLPAYGTLGTVTSTAPLTVEWPDHKRSVLHDADESRVTAAWAVTSAVARRLPGRNLHLLGRLPGLDLVEGRAPAGPRHGSTELERRTEGLGLGP